MASKKMIIRDLHDLQIRMKKLEEDINNHYIPEDTINKLERCLYSIGLESRK